MRYKDYDDTANDGTNIGYDSFETNKRKQQTTDDYEFLENDDFISHLESSGLLRKYIETSCQNETNNEIHIDLDFMEDPSFYYEVECFDKLNTTLENELLELDVKLTTPPSANKLAHAKSRKKRKFSFAVTVCALLVSVLLIGSGYVFFDTPESKNDVYAFNSDDNVAKKESSINQTVALDKDKVLTDKEKTEEKKSNKSTTEAKVDKKSQGKLAQGVSDNKTANKEKVKEFQNAAFIGNSLVVGLMQNCNISGASFFACQSLSIGDAFEKAFVYDRQKGTKLTILQALSKSQFKRIYLMFGINELGWPYPSVFIEKYQNFIKRIREIQPSAVIYVQSILPVTKSCSDKKSVFTKGKVKERNELLKKMCKAQHIVYLDVFSSLCNKNGYLPENISTDGIHLRKTGYSQWLNFLKEEIRKE